MEFISGMIQCVDGERDPRNLLKFFDLFQQVFGVARRVAKIDSAVRDLAEELFDVVSCYFPITFNPPKDDPHRITPQQLSDSLM